MSILSDYTTENYLKAMVKYVADPTRDKITTGELAELLAVTSGTATAMIKKLEKEEYVTYIPHHGCSLTPKGAEYGLRILRRHRLLETFLVQVLDLDWTMAHDEAEKLEHSASDLLVETIASYLAHPDRDPHGNSIPTKAQTSYTIDDFSLLEAPRGEKVTISRVTGDTNMIRYLQQEQLVPDVVLTVKERDANTGLAVVQIGNEEKTISLKTMEHLFYEK